MRSCLRWILLSWREKIFYLVHSVDWLDRLILVVAGVAVVVSGHSHKPGIETRGGVMYLNPGRCRASAVLNAGYAWGGGGGGGGFGDCSDCGVVEPKQKQVLRLRRRMTI